LPPFSIRMVLAPTSIVVPAVCVRAAALTKAKAFPAVVKASRLVT